MDRWRGVGLTILLFAVAMAACARDSGDGQAAPTSAAANAVDTPTSTSTGDPEDSLPVEDESADIDIAELLQKDPLVIFNAYPPKPDDIEYALPPGQRDFYELWEPAAPWQNALEHIDIYRLHAFQMRHFMDDEQVVTLIEFLREHEIPLMFETEPLIPPTPDECAHTESYEAPWDLEMAVRLKELGGEIDLIAIEEPYHFGHLLDTPEACQYTVERVVDEVLAHVGNLRELFGDIPVGTIEPIWSTPQTEPRDMEIWLDTFESIAGEPFAFLHVDPNWYRADWADIAVGIEAVADARDVPFGILYNGGSESDGRSWMNFMMANAAEFEIDRGGTPQHVSIQSWVDWPDHALPETDLTALTSGVLRYFGERLTMSVRADGDDLLVNVMDSDGQGVPNISLEVSRLVGENGISSQSVQGVVPEGFTEALILVRANAEDATRGTVDATLREVVFTSGASETNLIPNSDFAAGLRDWGVYGSHPSGVRSVAVGTERGLSLEATPDQDIYIDGTRFPVTSGDEFEFSVTYELGEGSADSVVVSVAFVDVSRSNIFLHPLPNELGEFSTDAEGIVRLPAELIGDGPAQIRVSSDGDLQHWPVSGLFDLE